MKLKIYSLRDQKTDQYLNPMAMQTAGQIIRMLQDEMQNNKENMIGAHAEDFELFEIGEFDSETGVITGHTPKSVSVLSDLKPKQ